jgi:hypothetical protein
MRSRRKPLIAPEDDPGDGGDGGEAEEKRLKRDESSLGGGKVAGRLLALDALGGPLAALEFALDLSLAGSEFGTDEGEGD